jgi:hypothetical protein
MKLVLTAVLALAGSALAQQPYSTPTTDCSEIGTGKTQTQQTEARSVERARAFATITASRPAGDTDARHCHVAYALLFSESGEPYKTVATFEEDGQEAFGVNLVGFSPDESKVAANFWYAAGDFDAVRSAIYDRATRKSVVKELGDQITSQLPPCDYTMEMTAITNSGEVVVHIPSRQGEESCPDQGDWLFNLRSGKVRRVGKAR